ncbi:AAA family ATPase [Radiobacillus sp. PE A8.2]|uniref:AAA family ATPase n=1 Tax=Radiobacillus sp. PE A8.2 TaxID=3380349 RepID=UPI00388F98E8
MELSDVKNLVDKVKNNIQKVIVGKSETIDLLLIALISSGHVLLEDVPGTGKTMLAKTMAKSLSCTFKRIQFTPDLLPTDVTGLNFYNQQKGQFEFQAGAIFANIVLADEINRATPRTQSSLLESMEERQVTIDGETRLLKRPFMVIATQNPVENQGTFPLPEAQLDRFLIKLRLGYPSRQEGIDILKRFIGNDPLEIITEVVDEAEILAAQKSYSSVFVSDDILSYMMDIVESTRSSSNITLGVSPRGSQALLKAVQAYAAIKGREYVIPDDVKAMVQPVLAHRIVVKQTIGIQTNQAARLLEELVKDIAVPTESELEKGLHGK